METFINFFFDQRFVWGVVVGICVLGWLGVFSLHTYKRLLTDKANSPHQTAEKLLDGKFYYLVEESEYNQSFRNTMALNSLRNEVDWLRSQVQHATATTNGAYTERNKLVALLTRLFPSGTQRNREYPEWPLVYVDLPTGQASWHIPPLEFEELFGQLPIYPKPWDQHTTEEKYRRVLAVVAVNQSKELDVLGIPKLKSTLLEEQAIIALNSVKAWVDGGDRLPMPMELQMQLDLVLNLASIRRQGVRA